jgi:molybdenum cofactor synthesis domain-containing protein
VKTSDRESWPSGEPAPKARPARSGPPLVEVISVGRELLHGWFPDGNGRTIAETLSARGAHVTRLSVVDDDLEAVAGAVREALERHTHLVITSGGLGPARDDVTLAAVARTLGRTMVTHPAAKAQVERAYVKLARAHAVPTSGLTAWREKLCRVPVGALPIPNEKGTSPGVVCRLPGGAAVICLPGRPHELKPMLGVALDEVADIAPPWQVVRREIESPTADEASLRDLLDKLGDEFPGMWVTTHPSGSKRRGARIFITLEAAAPKREDAQKLVDDAERRLRALITGAY